MKLRRSSPARARAGHLVLAGACFPALLGLATLAGLATLGGHAAVHSQPLPSPPIQDFVANRPGTYSLPVIQQAGDGWVLERNRLPRRLSRYTRGATTLLSFIYTYCTDPTGCPLAYASFAELRERVRADPALRGEVRFVSLSFDPVNDTPELMQAYGGLHANGDDPPWHFLTTYSMGFLKPILERYGQDVEVERDAAGAPTRARTHLLKVFLIDRSGRVREIYSTAFLHAEVIFNDIKTLALEAAGGPAEARAGDRAAASLVRAPAAGDDAFGLPPLRVAPGVVLDPARIELGRTLFFDRRLSLNGTMSCAMCHVPEEGFASNASRRAIGIAGKTLRRNAPSLVNVAWQSQLFHDGRESSLVAQAWQPILHADEMANVSAPQVLGRLRADAGYRSGFARAFGGAGPSKARVAAALAAFEATLVSAGSRFDRWKFGGDAEALSGLEQRGFAIFTGKGRCSACHLVGERHALFSDGKFHVTGAGFELRERDREPVTVPLAPGVQTVLDPADLAAFAGDDEPDAGRFAVTLDPADRFAFRTAPLRNVTRSAPYMHDGSLASLEAVIEFYDRGGGEVPGKSALLGPLGLDAGEKQALVAFLRSLEGANADRLAALSRPADGTRPTGGEGAGPTGAER